MYFLFSTNNI